MDAKLKGSTMVRMRNSSRATFLALAGEEPLAAFLASIAEELERKSQRQSELAEVLGVVSALAETLRHFIAIFDSHVEDTVGAIKGLAEVVDGNDKENRKGFEAISTLLSSIECRQSVAEGYIALLCKARDEQRSTNVKG